MTETGDAPTTGDALADRVAEMAREAGLEIGFAALHVESGRRFAVNAEAVFPTASIFKVPVMLEVLRQIETRALAVDRRLALRTAQKTLNSGVLLTLEDGLALTLRDLITLMIIISDNTATTMLLELVGKRPVQDLLERLGCPDSTVTMTVHEMFLHAWNLPLDRPVGVPELIRTARTVQMDYDSLTFARDRRNTVSTAADMVRLMGLIARGEAVSPDVSAEALRIMGQTQTTERVPRYLPHGTVANKTGTFRGLRNDCGIVHRSDGERMAYAIFSFDPTPLPIEDEKLYMRRSTLVGEMMGEIGLMLYRGAAA